MTPAGAMGYTSVSKQTRFETPADRLLGQAISDVAVSQKSVSLSGQSQLGCHEPNGVNGYLYSPGVLDISTISLMPV